MVGISEAFVEGVYRNKLNIRGENEAVYDIVLGVLGVRRVIRLVEKAAARRFEIVRKRPALRHDILAYRARFPQILVRVGVFLKPIGENLIEVAAGYNIVALFVLGLNKLTQLLCLRDLALAVVISLQMEIYDNKLAVCSGYGQIAYEQAALWIFAVLTGQLNGQGSDMRSAESISYTVVVRSPLFTRPIGGTG